MVKNKSFKGLKHSNHTTSSKNLDAWERVVTGLEKTPVAQITEEMESMLLWQAPWGVTRKDDLFAPLKIPERQIQETSVADRMSAMEKRLKSQESSIKELEFKINSTLLKDHMERVLEYTKKLFVGSEYVTQAHYVVLHDRALHMIFIHSLDDRVEALTSICKNARKIMNMFPDTEVTPIILHEAEVRHDHLIGTTPIFEKIQESG